MGMDGRKRPGRAGDSATRVFNIVSRQPARVLAYLAPNLEEDQLPVRPVEFRSQAARGESSPRRYVGKSATATGARPNSRGAVTSLPAVERRGGRGPVTGARPVSLSAGPWSTRLLVTVGLIGLLFLGLRLTGITTAPVDAPTGVESTHAAFVNMLAGRVGGSLDPVRFFPPPAPWYGPAPANPAGGLPLFGWITAATASLAGAGYWVGRVVAAIFGLLAGLVLFNVVRQAAGARAGLYALLFYSLAPLSVVLGQQYSPATVSLFAQAVALSALLRWRIVAQVPGSPGASRGFVIALATGVFASLVDPGSIFLAVVAAYLMLTPPAPDYSDTPGIRRLPVKPVAQVMTLRERWTTSPNRGRLIGYAAALLGSVALWQLIMSGGDGTLVLGIGDGGGGLGDAVGALLQGGTYVQVVGTLMEKLLSILGAPLLVAGLLRGARRPAPLLFHAWALAGLAHVLADASRIGRHDDGLLPLILPLCALIGIGAAWAGSLPARVWLAITEQKQEHDSEYTVSPHTSWLLDLPEEKAATAERSRPQAQLAFGKSVAQRAQQAGARARRAWVMGIGNLALLAALTYMALSGWHTLNARLQPSAVGVELAQTGREVAAATAPGSRLIVIGSLAPELFYASGRTGWAITADDFGMGKVETLKAEGAAYLLSTDQEWLGRQPDYAGLLSSFSVARLGRDYILFDLTTKSAANDHLYFLQSGHTLGGEFRRFWEQNGGVARLGYPISEEVDEANPIDGVVRRVQYFERAVLEYHPEYAGTPNAVMLASVGRWATMGRDFPKVAPFESTPQRAYFPETGHAVREAFLKYWQTQGGLAAFGYPISEELPEINPGDGKVYTVQYFERARFEWHPSEAGTPEEVQLGLIGKQALEARNK